MDKSVSENMYPRPVNFKFSSGNQAVIRLEYVCQFSRQHGTRTPFRTRIFVAILQESEERADYPKFMLEWRQLRTNLYARG